MQRDDAKMDERPRGALGSPHKPTPVKKAYAPPMLVAWGTLRTMTRKVGNKGAADGGGTKNKTKTR
jgi:hypothetical protein